LPQEVCDSLSKSSARCNLGLTWDQTNFFASKSLASVRLWNAKNQARAKYQFSEAPIKTIRGKV
jgi:hypothetical protein